MIIDTDAIKKAIISGTEAVLHITKNSFVLAYARFKGMKKSNRIIALIVLLIVASFLTAQLFPGRELSITEHMAKAQGYARAENFSLMISHLTIAAKRGNKEAQYLLGVCYTTGTGVDKNLSEAFRWMHLSADQGHAEAQYRLTGFYSQGMGVEQDLATALQYLRLSANQGYPQAVEMLNDVNNILE